MLCILKVNQNDLSDFWLLGVLEFRNLWPRVYEKLGKQSFQALCGRPRNLLVRHSSAYSEMLGPLFHVIVVEVERRMLPQLSSGIVKL
jgi:hypothetical protein